MTPVLFIQGGHRNDGAPQAAFDKEALTKQAEQLKNDVSAFAVASHFATRNPEHELPRDILRSVTGLPCYLFMNYPQAWAGHAVR